ncbi:glycoside hydrolase family 13 protein [Streptococcus merionis]|uniref:glycoside hydrolase family 13 protein n=1 Tax=Streptococcus merionis TaxID=400065 RepID=UPI003512D3E4
MEYVKKWWQDEVIYQIYPRSFKDSNDDGIGDILGIIEKLDYLNDLGITSIWICPIFQSPMADNGYDISDYFAISEEFGTMEDVKELIAEAKKRGIKIILDLVVNHTSDEHAWFQEALHNPDSKYRDYYIFKSGTEAPNNWRSIFGGSVWEKLPNEDAFYYHTFHKKQPDLNWENPALREEIYQMVNTWLEIGIAGFRIDAITFIKKNLTFTSQPADGVDGLVKCTKASRNQPGIEVFLAELNERCFKKYDCVTIAEAPGVPYDQLDSFIGPNGFFSMIFDFKHADLDIASGSEWFKRVDWTPQELFRILEDSQLAIQQSGWGAPFIENHDQPRATSKYLLEHATTPEAVKAMGLMYFFLRGTPFIYQGQELGLINFKRSSIEEFNDISSIDQYYRGMDEGLTQAEALEVINLRSRDNARTPMPWTDDVFVGFSNHEPCLPITERSSVRQVAYQISARDSVLAFYKDMIALKKDERYSTLTHGEIHFPERGEEAVFLYRRSSETDSYLIVVNLSNEATTIILDKQPAKILLSNQDINLDQYQNHRFQLPAFGAIVIEEEN